MQNHLALVNLFACYWQLFKKTVRFSLFTFPLCYMKQITVCVCVLLQPFSDKCLDVFNQKDSQLWGTGAEPQNVNLHQWPQNQTESCSDSSSYLHWRDKNWDTEPTLQPGSKHKAPCDRWQFLLLDFDIIESLLQKHIYIHTHTVFPCYIFMNIQSVFLCLLTNITTFSPIVDRNLILLTIQDYVLN